MESTLHAEEEKKAQPDHETESSASHKRTTGKRLKEGAAHTVT